jgi:putative ABC transport system permease protein
VITIGTLALGIGATTAMFTVVNTVLLRPLPYHNPDRVVAVYETYPDFPRFFVKPFDFLEYQQHNTVFESVAAHLRRGNEVLTGGDEPLVVWTGRVSANLFPLLGVAPIQGRTFYPEEDQPGNDDVMILSHGFWQQHFGADPDVIGRPMVLSNRTFTIVGVMPSGFELPELGEVDGWRPWAMSAGERRHDWGHIIPYLTARLKSGATVEQARQELGAIATRLVEEYPESHADLGIRVEPMLGHTVGPVRAALWMLLAAAGLVLLIACTNVAGMLLSRTIERQREIAIRRALGASRWRLIRLLLTEGLILGLAGAATGLLAAYWGVRLLLALTPERLPRTYEVAIDGHALGFALAVALVSVLICSLVPALRASGLSPVEALKGAAGSLMSGGRSLPPGGRHVRPHGVIVIAQVALSLLLLVGAGLFVRSFAELQRVDPGFEAENLLLANISLSSSRYDTRVQQAEFFTQLTERVSGLPYVHAVALTMFRPIRDGYFNGPWEIGGATPGQPTVVENFRGNTVTPDYFLTMGIPLLRGRIFSASEGRQDGSSLAVINETMATRYFPDGNAIGKRMGIYEIVGIVGDVRQAGRFRPAPAQAYFSMVQRPVGAPWMVIRTDGDPLRLVPAVRAQVLSIDPDQPVARFATMEELLADSLAEQRFSMFLMSVFGALALMLVIGGIYGVASYSVARRTHEFGIRRALGGGAPAVFFLVLHEGLRLSLTGLALGLVAALSLTRLISSQLYGLSATDPLTFVAACVGLVGVLLVASYVPARRATRADPMEALRYE